jgi:hypothetical protein
MVTNHTNKLHLNVIFYVADLMCLHTITKSICKIYCDFRIVDGNDSKDNVDIIEEDGEAIIQILYDITKVFSIAPHLIVSQIDLIDYPIYRLPYI